MSPRAKPCVWIVEDSPLEAEVAARALGSDFDVVMFSDGPSMLERLAQGSPPDVVLLDWNLPVLSGIEICQFLRKRGAPDMGILIVTGVYSKTRDLVQGLAAGANDYVVKPYVPEELAARVAALVRTKTLRERAARAETSLRTVLEELPDPLFALDADWRVRFVNREAVRLFPGATNALERPLAEVAPALAGLTPGNGALEAVTVGGHIYTPALRQLALDERGPLTIIMLRDITDSERQLSTRDNFLAMLAHELRNPLAPIRTALEVAKLEPHIASQRPFQIMERQVARLVRLVDDLLDVSRITRGQIELQHKRVDIPTVLARAVEDTQPVLDAQHHEIVVDLEDRTMAVDGDAVRLEQIFTNLLNNAAKYTAPGGRLRIEARRDDGDIVVRIIDNGIGIDAALQPRIFDMFVQAETSLARTRGGLGIGLTLVKQMTEMHGGTVDVRSAGPGRGSTFEVRLAASDLPAAPTRARLAQRPASAPLRVLVVDDNTDAAELLATALEARGHVVEVTGDGASAVARALTFEPKVVLLDIGLPGIDGYSVARRLRAEPSLNASVIIGITGYGQAEDRRRSKEAGFDEHLVKPIELDQLWAVLAARTAS